MVQLRDLFYFILFLAPRPEDHQRKYVFLPPFPSSSRLLRSLRLLGNITIYLFFIVSVLLSVLFPAAGRLWMRTILATFSSYFLLFLSKSLSYFISFHYFLLIVSLSQCKCISSFLWLLGHFLHQPCIKFFTMSFTFEAVFLLNFC